MSKNILCVGFTPALQRIMTFSALRLGEVNRACAQDFSPAGKGVNVGKVLKALGSAPCITGFLAGASGETLARLIRELNLQAHWLWCDGETRNAHTLIDGARGEVTELVEEAVNPSDALWEEAFVLIDRLMASASSLALCGALPPGAKPSVYARVVKLANAHGLPCVVDAKGGALTQALSEGPFLVKMNAEELAHTTGCATQSEDGLLEGLDKLKSSGARNILVTQGKDTAYLSTKEALWSFKTPNVKVLNPIGSGDAVTAGILHAKGKGRALEEAVAYGIACGSANAETAGPGELQLSRVSKLVPEVKYSKEAVF